MSSDREEIRWKFQIIIDMTNAALKIHEDARKETEEQALLLVHELEKIRNSFLAGIAFVIGLFVSLIAVGVFDKNYTWYVIIGIVAGLGIFVGFNWLAMREYMKSNQIYEKLQASEIMASNLKSSILMKAIDENMTKDQVLLLIEFIGVLLQAISYNLGILNYKIFKTEKPAKTEYVKSYENAKSKLVIFKTLDLNDQIPVIESFIKEFEFHSKLSK